MKRTLFAVLLLASLTTAPPRAWAVEGGGWVSSGGELLKDSHNPWWVKNTTEVKYCIQIDEISISTTPRQIHRIVDSALRYWVTEFARRTAIFESSEAHNLFFNMIGVGSQTFRRIDCDGSEDLRLQFGYGTLSPTQKNYLRTPERFVGIAVRTEYDETQLRGKGFVYITSDIGPHKYAASPNMMEAPWRHEALLYFAVVHELGHVFGIPHIGDKFSLMSAEFPEVLTSKEIELVISDLHESDFDFFFVPKKEFSGCLNPWNQAASRAFFELPEGYDCLRFTLDDARARMTITARMKDSTQEIAIGTIEPRLEMTTSPIGGITLVLNPKQLVFPVEPDSRMLPGPGILKGRGPGKLRLANGTQKPLVLSVGPTELEIIGLLDGELHQILTWWF